MKNEYIFERKKFYVGFILIIFILLSMLFIPQAAAESETVNPVNNNLKHQVEPVIYGDYIVWTDYRNDNGSGMNSDIFLYDMSTHQEHAICTNDMRQVRPDIYGTWMAWEDNRNGVENWDIYIFDLSTGSEKRIQKLANQNNPAIYKNLIVWEDVGRRGAARHDNDIYIYDINTDEDYPITDEEGEQIDADIYGNYIVWTDRRNGNADIFIYDLSLDSDSDGAPNYIDSDDDGDNVPDAGDLDPDPAEQPLITNPDRQHNPAIFGDYVIWQDHRNGNSDIYMYNLKNKTEIPLVTSSADECVPRIYDKYVVFERLVDTQREIFYYDLTTAETYQITYQPSSQEFPDIYGRNAVWVDYRNDKDGRVTQVLVDNGDIYMYRIPHRDIKNTPPVVTGVTAVPESVEVQGEVAIIVEAFDDDGDTLEFSFTYTGGTILKIDNNKAIWQAPDNVGFYNISVYAYDQEFFSNTMTVMVRVYKNEPPEIINVSVAPEQVKTGRATTISVLATDPDGDRLVYDFFCSKGEISDFESKYDNEVTWTAPGKEGDYQIIINVSDYSQQYDETLSTQQRIITISVLPREPVEDNGPGFLPGFEIGAIELVGIASLIIIIKILGINRFRKKNH